VLSGRCRYMLYNWELKGDPFLVFSSQESNGVFSNSVESMEFSCINGKHDGIWNSTNSQVSIHQNACFLPCLIGYTLVFLPCYFVVEHMVHSAVSLSLCSLGDYCMHLIVFISPISHPYLYNNIILIFNVCKKLLSG